MTDLNKAPAVGVTDALRAFVAIPPLQYGAVGTRDVDVGCWQRAHAAAVAALAGAAQGAEPPDHFPPREAFIWNLGFRAGAETATLDVVQAAADASSVGHLSALLDIQTALLGRAMAVMKAVEGAASPANEGSGDFTATIPYGAWAEFVDARAGLLYAVAQSPIGASPQPTGTEKKA